MFDKNDKIKVPKRAKEVNNAIQRFDKKMSKLTNNDLSMDNGQRA